MKSIRLMKETRDDYIFRIESMEGGEDVRMSVLTDLFHYQRVPAQTASPYVNVKKSDLYGAVGIRAEYCLNGIVLDTTETIMLHEIQKQRVTLKSIRSYVGGSLTVISEKFYDQYRFCCVETGEVIESEDWQITGTFVKENLHYYVECYSKKDDAFLLEAVSEDTLCEFLAIEQKNPIISIIVPVYNAKDFLPRTVDAIMLSTMAPELEIVLIDDGSKDSSFAVCQDYAERYENIKAYHKENGGPGPARNYGLDKVSGEFTAFVDSDDVIHPYMYEKLYQATKDYHTDVAIAQAVMRTDFQKYELVLASKLKENVVIKNSYEELLKSKGTKNNIHFVALWNKITRTSLIQKVRFMDDMPHYEDTAYTNTLYTYIDKFVLIKDAYYAWDKRKQKTVGTFSSTPAKEPNEIIWKYFVISYASPLIYGRQDSPEVTHALKYDVIMHLLSRCHAHNNFGKKVNPVKNTFYGMVKWLVAEYDLPVEELKQNDRHKHLYEVWVEIRETDLELFDGRGEIPRSYYQH